MNAFVESMKRLYQYGLVDMAKIIILFNDGKITEDEKIYILEREK